MLKKKMKEGYQVTASQDVERLSSPTKNKINRSKSEKKALKLRKSRDLYEDSEEEDLLGEI